LGVAGLKRKNQFEEYMRALRAWPSLAKKEHDLNLKHLRDVPAELFFILNAENLNFAW